MYFLDRWTVRADCMKSVLINYEELLILWEKTLDSGVSDSDMKARIIGVQSVMGKFDYLMSKTQFLERYD